MQREGNPMKKFMLTIATLVTVVTLAGCGADNVASCNKWKEKVKCGTVSVDAVNCDAYKNTTCDISAYFDCMSDAYVCKDGQYDTTKLANATSCASKATCK